MSSCFIRQHLAPNPKIYYGRIHRIHNRIISEYLRCENTMKNKPDIEAKYNWIFYVCTCLKTANNKTVMIVVIASHLVHLFKQTEFIENVSTN